MSLVIVFIPVATNGKKNMSKAIAFANDYCHIPPMAGEIRELTGGLDIHIDWVKKLEAKAAISVSDSNKIQQELKDYSAQTELLHQSLEQACRHYAICYYKMESRTACSKEYEDQQQMESRLDPLLGSIG
jgi:hypothetical protein